MFLDPRKCDGQFFQSMAYQLIGPGGPQLNIEHFQLIPVEPNLFLKRQLHNRVHDHTP